jgi:hypothetical protein
VGDKVVVEASVAQVTGALKTMGDGGFRMTFDAPESELPEYIRIHLLRNKRLRLTIEEMDDGTPAKVRGWKEPKLKK